MVLVMSCRLAQEENPKTPEVAKAITYETIKEVPRAAVNEPEVALEFMKVLNAHQEEFQITDIVITSARWASSFNKAGHIVSRSREAAALVYETSGCYLKLVVFEQKTMGNSYAKITVVNEKPWKVLDCNLLENKNPNLSVGVVFED